MDITASKEGITGTINKLCEKIFKENVSLNSRQQPFEVRFDNKICRRLRKVAYGGLLSHWENELNGQDGELTVKQKLCVIGYKLRINGLESKAEKLEHMVSKLDFSSSKQSTFQGQFQEKIHEVEAVVKILLILINEQKLLTPDVCEVWRKTSNLQLKPCYADPPPYHCKSSRTEKNILDYEYFPREIFEAEPSFGVPKKTFEKENICRDLFTQTPGFGTKWFGVLQKNEDSYTKRTRLTLFNALVHSQTSDMNVKLTLPDLPSDPMFHAKPPAPNNLMISQDTGFTELPSDDSISPVSISNEDSGIYDLSIWDKALKHEPSRYHTWEGRKQIICTPSKPYFTEAGPKILDSLYDIRLWEASYLINVPMKSFQYVQMRELIRDGIMVLIGVPSRTFQLDNRSASFLVSSSIRLSGCTPKSLQLLLKRLADIGTNYYRVNKFTTCQKHSTLNQSSVLRAFIAGLNRSLREYRRSVVVLKVTDVQSVLELAIKFKSEAYKLRFLADICMCFEGFSAEPGQPKPKFPVGVELLSYLYQSCLINMCSPVANLILFLLKTSCAPYLRFLQQWAFEGKCVDMYKEFMIYQNDIYLSSRDKYYWTNGYVMASKTKMDGVPEFLKVLADDMFTCGKSINLMKLCYPKHYICNHNINLPIMSVSYSLEKLKTICESSKNYCNEMAKLKEKEQKEWEKKQNEEKIQREQVLIHERQKANKALAEMEDLVKKSKKALAEKKKEELDFLKQQMEDAIKRKIFEAKKADEVDAEAVRAFTLYEVTTAKLEDKMMEEVREELLRHYELLTLESKKREEKAIWLQRRYGLKQKREQFLKDEVNDLKKMREQVEWKITQDKQLEMKKRQNEENVDGTSLTFRDTMVPSGTSQQQSTIQDLLYPSIPVTDTALPHAHEGNQERSTVQDLLYPLGSPSHIATPSTRGGSQEQSVVQDILYPSGSPSNIMTPPIRGGSQEQSVVQDLLYPSGSPSHIVSLSTHEGSQEQSVVQNILYPSGSPSKTVAPSTRGGRQDKTKIQDLLYPSETTSNSFTPSTRGGRQEQNIVQGLLYPSGSPSNTVTSSTRGERQEQSMIQDLLYPSSDVSEQTSRTISTRGESQEQSMIQDLLYPSSGVSEQISRTISTRGHAPQSTIQNLIYPRPKTTQEPEEERKRFMSEDVWLDLGQFEPYPDNFDVLNEKPSGDILLQVIKNRKKINGFYSSGTEDDVIESENDACDVLSLPVILRRCVMEPLMSQINIVNSATVRYFMHDLNLVGHFETLKKFLLMEDGEFSFSLSQQLFEKVSSGVTPQQLCCISTLNAIMSHAIQSSVYACQSDNTRSLSFVLQSLPNMFKRNDIGFFDFIQLRYLIQWPVNIVITENCITKYNRIFAFMLRLKRTVWILQDMRYFLKRMDKHASNSPQVSKIHLFRHEMNHFVTNVQGYISNQILHLTWQEFLHSLEQNVRNLDDLHTCHTDYLNKALFRALLNKKAGPVTKIIADLLTMVLKFHTQLVSSSWSTDSSSGQVVHPSFSLLCKTHGKFKESTGFLFTVISKLVSRGYQPHLQELLLRLNFNFYYGSVNDGNNI